MLRIRRNQTEISKLYRRADVGIGPYNKIHLIDKLKFGPQKRYRAVPFGVTIRSRLAHALSPGTARQTEI